VNHLKQETQKLNKLREGIQRKLRDVESHKVEVEQQRESLRSQVIAIERGLFHQPTDEITCSFFMARRIHIVRYIAQTPVVQFVADLLQSINQYIHSSCRSSSLEQSARGPSSHRHHCRLSVII